jgi:hypothetical protein
MTRFSSQALNDLLGTGISQLDITQAEHRLAVARYTAVARSLAEHWNIDPYDGLVYPQGSMRLGTITRKYHRHDEIDIDLVARRDQPKQSVSQADLKADAGVGLEKFVLSEPEGAPSLDEGKRCWTLHYSGFHLDVLPALPNPDADSASAIIITDTELVRWQFSDPVAYARWFHTVMADEIKEKLKILAKRMDIAAVPDWPVKTTLQQTVQALKRHRDIYFTEALDLRPASIIITTLAAHAYRGSGGDLYEVLDDITDRMPGFVLHDGQRYIVANPVEPRENFTDRWHGKPERAEAFFRWIEQARTDFDGLARGGGGLDTVISKMASVFGDRPAGEAGRNLSRGIVESRRQGQLSYGAGTGTLAAGAITGTRRITRDHDFHGRNGARP